jgi:hypothetical protein
MPITSNPVWRRQPDPPPKSQPSREQAEPPNLRHPPRQPLPRNPTDRDAFGWQKVPKRPQPLRPFFFAPSAPNQPVAVSLVEAGNRRTWCLPMIETLLGAIVPVDAGRAWLPLWSRSQLWPESCCCLFYSLRHSPACDRSHPLPFSPSPGVEPREHPGKALSQSTGPAASC